MSENRIVPSWSSAPPSVNEPSPQTFSSFAPGARTPDESGSSWGNTANANANEHRLWFAW